MKINRRTRLFGFIAGCATLALVWNLALMATPVLAGHTQGGDCWRSGTPLLCRTTWTSARRVINLNLYNQFTQVRPAWLANATAACDAWHNFVFTPPPGNNDIWCHWTPYGETAVYLKTGTNGQHDLDSMTNAVTWNCNTGGLCFDVATVPLNIWYSEIYFNLSGTMDALSSSHRTNVFAHEIGHTLGLAHHNTTSYLMYKFDTAVQGPTSGDYGALPACSGAASTYGVRCVFGFDH